MWFIDTVLSALCAVLYMMDAALGQSLPPRQGLKSISSSRQLAAHCDHTTVHEELDEDASLVNDGRVYFDVGDDVSYVIVLLSVFCVFFSWWRFGLVVTLLGILT